MDDPAFAVTHPPRAGSARPGAKYWTGAPNSATRENALTWQSRNTVTFLPQMAACALTAQCTDGASPAAMVRQRAGGVPGDTAQGKQELATRHGFARQRRPARRAKRRGTGMAGRGKRGGQKNRVSAGDSGTRYILYSMGRTADRAAMPQIGGLRARKAPGPQMNPGAQRLRQPDIPRHHKHQPPGPADARQSAAQPRTVRRAIMAKHHAAQAFWQSGGRCKRIPAA